MKTLSQHIDTQLFRVMDKLNMKADFETLNEFRQNLDANVITSLQQKIDIKDHLKM